MTHPVTIDEKQNHVLNIKNGRMKNNGATPELIGKSPQMEHVLDSIQRAAKADSNVLILGESGSGKEVVARNIHALSYRASNPFVAINCTAIPDSLLESELFGHAKGSFTGATSDKRGLVEEANGGVLFLDEIGDMNAGLQAKLLRVIQDRKIKPVGQNEQRDIDVRIISATHRDLQKAMEIGAFREDLFYRLNVMPIMVPPLREHIEDIPLLVEHFLRNLNVSTGLKPKRMTARALDLLKEYQWRGNIRQLANVVERVFVFCDSDLIDKEHVIFAIQPGECLNKSPTKIPQSDPNEVLTFAQMEKNGMIRALLKSGGNKEVSARLLGISRKTFYRKEREYGLTDK